MSERTEFGAPRTVCGCRNCVTNCRYLPGYLIPSDLGRMVPERADPLVWAESNLRASPGALAMRDGMTFRIHTLVPANRPDGSCIYFEGGKRQGKCGIHENAPFGCAFFDCGKEPAGLSQQGLIAIMRDGPEGLYARIWRHLEERGLSTAPPEEKRARMRAAMAGGR